MRQLSEHRIGDSHVAGGEGAGRGLHIGGRQHLLLIEWHPGAHDGVEGVIDLAVYSESESAWQVIDWKTNRVGTTGSAGLVEIYRGQIQAYVRALREMLSAEVKGSLYLTQTGEWVPVE